MKSDFKIAEVGADTVKRKREFVVHDGKSQQHRAGGPKTKKKRKPLTPEEKAQQKQRFMDLGEEKQRKAFEYLSKWTTGFLSNYDYGKPNGIISNIEMSVEEICRDCVEAIWEGRRRWLKTWELETQLVYVAKSEISNIIRKNIRIFYLDPYKMNFVKDVSNQLDAEILMREEGYERAWQVVGDNSQFQSYLKALKETNCYVLIADKMGLDLKEVKNVERKLLAHIKKTLWG